MSETRCGARRRASNDPRAFDDLAGASLYYRESGNEFGTACILAELCRPRRRTGDVEAASVFFEEAATFRSTGDRNGDSEILEKLAGLAGASSTPP